MVRAVTDGAFLYTRYSHVTKREKITVAIDTASWVLFCTTNRSDFRKRICVSKYVVIL